VLAAALGGLARREPTERRDGAVEPVAIVARLEVGECCGEVGIVRDRRRRRLRGAPQKGRRVRVLPGPESEMPLAGLLRERVLLADDSARSTTSGPWSTSVPKTTEYRIPAIIPGAARDRSTPGREDPGSAAIQLRQRRPADRATGIRAGRGRAVATLPWLRCRSENSAPSAPANAATVETVGFAPPPSMPLISRAPPGRCAPR
jgi:hypothetical protein